MDILFKEGVVDMQYIDATPHLKMKDLLECVYDGNNVTQHNSIMINSNPGYFNLSRYGMSKYIPIAQTPTYLELITVRESKKQIAISMISQILKTFKDVI